MTLGSEAKGCFGPTELERMGKAFDEVWGEISHRFGPAGTKSSDDMRNKLALEILSHQDSDQSMIRLRSMQWDATAALKQWVKLSGAR